MEVAREPLSRASLEVRREARLAADLAGQAPGLPAARASARPATAPWATSAASTGRSACQRTDFVTSVLAGQPRAAEVLRRDEAGLNKEGRAFSTVPAGTVDVHALDRKLHEGALIVDMRPAADYAMGGHVPGTINIPLNGSFTTWAGWMIPSLRTST